MSARRRPAARPRTRPAKANAGPDRAALRIVAGSLGGRRIDAPGGSGTRPTTERVREASFNALASLGALDGARTIDPFGGSGALGIEALSRGAGHVTFAETNGAARAVIEANLSSLDLAERACVRPGDGVVAVGTGGPWDLVLADPPYDFERWDDLLAAIAASLADGGVAVLESDRELDLPDGLVGTRTRTYGGTVVQFATRAGAPR